MARFYFDEDISSQLVRLLLERGHDVHTVDDARLRTAADYEQLLYVSLTNRLLVTHNEADFKLLHGAWRRWSAAWSVGPIPDHPGILIIPQTPRLRHRDAVVVLEELVESGAELRNLIFAWRRRSGWTPVN